MATRKAKGTGRAKQADTAIVRAGENALHTQLKILSYLDTLNAVRTSAGQHALGDYPNVKNVREWMRLYFGQDEVSTDCIFDAFTSANMPDISTARDAIVWGLSSGLRPTDVGRAKAYELGLLSDDSPAVLISKGKTTHRRGSKRKHTAHDREIYQRHKHSGESYGAIALRFDMDVKEVESIFWKMDKRAKRKK